MMASFIVGKLAVKFVCPQKTSNYNLYSMYIEAELRSGRIYDVNEIPTCARTMSSFIAKLRILCQIVLNSRQSEFWGIKYKFFNFPVVSLIIETLKVGWKSPLNIAPWLDYFFERKLIRHDLGSSSSLFLNFNSQKLEPLGNS